MSHDEFEYCIPQDPPAHPEHLFVELYPILLFNLEVSTKVLLFLPNRFW